MMKKKIGYVMAYKDGQNNYGTQLQGYALLRILCRMGYDVEIIHYLKKIPIWQKFLVLINALLLGNLRSLLSKAKKNPAYKIYPNVEYGINLRTKFVNVYKNKYFVPYFHTYRTYKELCDGSKHYDAFVVGSDQVWLPSGLPTMFTNLLFVDKNVRKISYASSFGVGAIPLFQKKITGLYLNRFFKIGVREQQGKEIVESLSNNKAQVVADPTLLLTREEWEKEISVPSNCSVDINIPYIFCYFLSNNVTAVREVEKLKKRTGYKVVCLRHMEKNSFHPAHELCGDEAPYDVDPNDFIRLISNASYVCTDSFHCSVFSVIFHKRFMTFYRSTDGGKMSKKTRIVSLFSVLGINEKHIFCNDIDDIDSEIDWNSVEINLNKLRTESILFLSEALK